LASLAEPEFGVFSEEGAVPSLVKGLVRYPLFWGLALGVAFAAPGLVKGLLEGVAPVGVLPVWNEPLAKEAPVPASISMIQGML